MSYIYVLSNPAMPSLVKIGLTKHSAAKRAAGLYTTGVPAPFTVEGSWKIPPALFSATETNIHRELQSYRYLDNREFFVLEVEEVTQFVDQFVRTHRLSASGGDLTLAEAWGLSV